MSKKFQFFLIAILLHKLATPTDTAFASNMEDNECQKVFATALRLASIEKSPLNALELLKNSECLNQNRVAGIYNIVSKNKKNKEKSTGPSELARRNNPALAVMYDKVQKEKKERKNDPAFVEARKKVKRERERRFPG